MNQCFRALFIILNVDSKRSIVDTFPEIDIANARMGIFGQALGTKGLNPPESYLLHPGDRVEIYRPLTSDPKDARRKRAEKSKEVDE